MQDLVIFEARNYPFFMSLPTKDLEIGRNTIFIEKTVSTNEDMKSLIESGVAPEGTVVYANAQIGGRGQGGNRWESEDGRNLLLSILLKPAFITPQNQAFLNIGICLALHDFLSSVQRQPVYIKWPNDIYINHKKVAGTLIENMVMGNRITSSIIGIGINVNQEQFVHPNAASLRMLDGEERDLGALRPGLFHAVERRYRELESQQPRQLMEEYEAKMYRKGELHDYRINSQVVQGEILGIDPWGRLRMVINGEVKYFANRELQML
jgi:BirA family biotin operon repressor/biotin-[acetyl-CoA-carboxylase] ligase